MRPDSVQTARVGLTEMDIETQLNAALYGQVASTIPEQDRMTKIRVRYPDRVRFDKDRLGQLPISLAAAAGLTRPAGGGRWRRPASIGFVPLEQLASIEVVRSPNELWRENQQPVITVTADSEGGDLGAVESGSCRPAGRAEVPPAIAGNWPANYRAQQESFAQLADGADRWRAALVFLLLGFQFHSLTLPLLIFLAQPISLASALFGSVDHRHAAQRVVVHGGDPADRAGREERHHLDRIHRPVAGRWRAARTRRWSRAGRTRFRPILMTSLTTIFGLVPLALGWGPVPRCSSRWRSP